VASAEVSSTALPSAMLTGTFFIAAPNSRSAGAE